MIVSEIVGTGKTKEEILISVLNEQFSNRLNIIGAEIGVRAGDFSEKLLKGLENCSLYLVDPYFAYLDGEGVIAQDTQNNYKKIAANRISVFGSRAKFEFTTSVLASRKIEDYFLDFVFIDANHTYESVLEDLNLWYPKVRTGGIFSGHDYSTATGHYWSGVVKAVDEFLTEKEYSVVEARDDNFWYIIKR